MADTRQPDTIKPDEQEYSVECQDQPSGEPGAPPAHTSGSSSSTRPASFYTAQALGEQDTELNDRRSETDYNNATKGVTEYTAGQIAYVPPYKQDAGITGSASFPHARAFNTGDSHAPTSNAPVSGDNRPAATIFHAQTAQKPLREPRGPPAGDLSETKVRLGHKRLGFKLPENQARLTNSAEKLQRSDEYVEKEESVSEDLATHRRKDKGKKDD
ncbi:uncharacterized protein N0V89_007300 [Didymosphaeria variabile]|uniref:Uncharacterized protein n=1 Tax=Didymosphaeria variabile TaxID=1932322 RepID=A0A9W9CA22_9PLEO|nr:uncharacterized protein N0V89_007300 [Didymosphaeria variabile]KAJ4351955.1 hypothetical protein N0V89_007300 [Didymosphaeria variabile]